MKTFALILIFAITSVAQVAEQRLNHTLDVLEATEKVVAAQDAQIAALQAQLAAEKQAKEAERQAKELAIELARSKENLILSQTTEIEALKERNLALSKLKCDKTFVFFPFPAIKKRCH